MLADTTLAPCHRAGKKKNNNTTARFSVLNLKLNTDKDPQGSEMSSALIKQTWQLHLTQRGRGRGKKNQYFVFSNSVHGNSPKGEHVSLSARGQLEFNVFKYPYQSLRPPLMPLRMFSALAELPVEQRAARPLTRCLTTDRLHYIPGSAEQDESGRKDKRRGGSPNAAKLPADKS